MSETTISMFIIGLVLFLCFILAIVNDDIDDA